MSRIIWVGNVPPVLLTNTEMESFFSEYGSIISAKVYRFIARLKEDINISV
jgi:RNA recognition motif-containing protein